VDDIKFMKRCLDLASKGIGYTYPNPLVGSVIVYNNKIIGEGYHTKYGESHAEVNAINSVGDKKLLRESTLYVNLEPCNHHGKTPPCTEAIINNGIKRVVIGSRDPNRLVDGNGIDKLRSSGCNVVVGVMELECSNLNKRFFKYHKHKRPYIILKWAESKDGFISPLKSNQSPREVNWISGENSKKLSHKWRSEEHSILVGVQTIIDDDPLLTTRFVDGKNPIRFVLDPNSRIPIDSKVLSEVSKTIILSKKENNLIPNYTKSSNFENIQKIIESLYDMKIQSVLIEGGTKTINHFLNNDSWDSIRVFKSNKNIKDGIKSPDLDFSKFSNSDIGDDILYEINR
jgi:diaminohydroxyphosphoribosylaminopyrimidine deaminase/5-amino-6-(5-phosphoribosylamino)uracil reductase